MATIYQSGYVFKDDGTAVEGATVQLYQADTTTTVESSTTTSAAGYWTLSTTTEHASGYDAKITSGSSVRYRRGNDRLQIEELDIRNDTGNGQGGLLVANTTNDASNKVATFAGRNSTRADNDEIYLSFEMNNSAGEIEEFARITAIAADVTDDEEDGQIKFGVSVDGTMTNVFTITSSESAGTDMNLDVSGDLTLDADGGDIFFKDGGTTFGSATNNSGNLIIKSGTTTALTFSGSSVTIGGDLTISGDDLVMATNTSGYVLVADGTNYNPVAVSGDVTMANDGAVTIASGSVETAMIAADAITGAKIADDAIDSEHYTDGSIDTAHIAADAVTAAKIGDDVIDSEHYTDASVDFAHIQNVAANSILGRDANSSGVLSEIALATTQILIGDGTGFTAASLSGDVTMANTGAVTIANDAVETAMIADDAVDSDQIAAGAIDNAHLADDAVDSDELAAGAVDTAHIADNNVTAAKIFDLARGSIIVGNASAATAELTVGSEDQVLTTDSSGDAVWATAAAGGISVGKSIALSMIF